MSQWPRVSAPTNQNLPAIRPQSLAPSAIAPELATLFVHLAAEPLVPALAPCCARSGSLFRDLPWSAHTVRLPESNAVLAAHKRWPAAAHPSSGTSPWPPRPRSLCPKSLRGSVCVFQSGLRQATFVLPPLCSRFPPLLPAHRHAR